MQSGNKFLTEELIADDRRILVALKKKFGSYTNIGIHLGMNRRQAGFNVSNWTRKGIPMRYKAMRPDLFMPHLFKSMEGKENP